MVRYASDKSQNNRMLFTDPFSITKLEQYIIFISVRKYEIDSHKKQHGLLSDKPGL